MDSVEVNNNRLARMHPPLHVHKHLHCKAVRCLAFVPRSALALSWQLTCAAAQAIEDLVYCHAEHALAKFWGVCNEQKWALDACLREEKAINRCVCRCLLICRWCVLSMPALASSQLLRTSTGTGPVTLLICTCCHLSSNATRP